MSKERDRPEWMDPSVVGEGRRPMHVPLHAYESASQALAMGVVDRAAHSPSRWRLPLSPAVWDFHLAPRPADAPGESPTRRQTSREVAIPRH